MRYHKLVRDRIPEIINDDTGVMPKIHIADDEEFLEKLKAKLVEEVEEFMKDPSIDELVDILEVIDGFYQSELFDRDEVYKAKEGKAFKRGAFTKRIILDEA